MLIIPYNRIDAVMLISCLILYTKAMRTTLLVSDDLLALARDQAARSGESLSTVIDRALRRGLNEPALAYQAELPAFGSSDGPAPTPADIRAILAADEAGR
jgi:hypothetical protein